MKIAIYIENKVRDLRPITWLGINLVSYGHTVILGETASIRNGLDTIEPDVWVRGGLSDSVEKIKLARLVREAGGALVIIESEGSLIGDKWYVESCINEQMSEYVNLHCTWGGRQSDLLGEHLHDYEDRIVTTGNPRFDLLSRELRDVYKEKCADYNNMYKNYILVVTNFGHANRDTASKSIRDPERTSYQKELLQEYIDSIKKLSDDIRNKIILRPHPREDAETYREALADSDNVYIVRDGSVRPWILGAEAVIHKSSTTGIEASLLDTPAISFRPIKNEKYDADLPILVSKEVTDYTELHQSLTKELDSLPVSLTSDIKEELKYNLHNFETPTAAPAIAEAIDSIDDLNNVKLNGIEPTLEQRIKRVAVRVFGDDIVETIGESVFGTDRSGVRNKFPGLSTQELEEEIKLLERVSTMEFPDIAVDEHPNLINTFSMRPQSE